MHVLAQLHRSDLQSVCLWLKEHLPLHLILRLFWVQISNLVLLFFRTDQIKLELRRAVFFSLMTQHDFLGLIARSWTLAIFLRREHVQKVIHRRDLSLPKSLDCLMLLQDEVLRSIALPAVLESLEPIDLQDALVHDVVAPNEVSNV